MKTQKLLLNETIKKLGRVGDVVEVSAGYARNYLVPAGLAVQPTPSNLKRVEERRKEVERVEKEERAKQEVVIKKLESVEVTLERRANETGRLFGGVSATDIAHALEAQGYTVDPGDVYLPGKIDRIETYQVTIAFADDLKTQIKVNVSPDQDSKEAIELYNADRKQREAAQQAAEG